MTIFLSPGNHWPSWTQWPLSTPVCRHLESSYFYVWLFSSPALLVSTLIIANKHIFGTYSAFSIFTVSEYLVMRMNLFSVFFWLRARWLTSSWLDFRIEFLFYSCIKFLPWGGRQNQNHLRHLRPHRILNYRFTVFVGVLYVKCTFSILWGSTYNMYLKRKTSHPQWHPLPPPY